MLLEIRMNLFATDHPFDSEVRLKSSSIILSSICLGIGLEVLLVGLSLFLGLCVLAILHNPFWWISKFVFHAPGSWLIVGTVLLAAVGWSIMFVAVRSVLKLLLRPKSYFEV